MSPLLQVRGLRKAFGGVAALDGVDLDVEDGELVSLIGPNGSGKSTLFNCITGLLRADEGRVHFKGVDITGARPDEIARGGIGRTFQDVRTFATLTVRDSLLVFAQQHQPEMLVQRFLRSPKVRRHEAEAGERADVLLDVIGLTRLSGDPSGSLSYGQRKLLGFAAALMPAPQLVMLDEPAAAVNPAMIERMKEYIRGFHATGTTFLIVEHNMDVVMDLSERVVVLDVGRKIAEGPPAEVQRNIEVQEAYFGR